MFPSLSFLTLLLSLTLSLSLGGFRGRKLKEQKTTLRGEGTGGYVAVYLQRSTLMCMLIMVKKRLGGRGREVCGFL